MQKEGNKMLKWCGLQWPELINRHCHENVKDRNYNEFTKQIKEYEILGLELLIVNPEQKKDQNKGCITCPT